MKSNLFKTLLIFLIVLFFKYNLNAQESCKVLLEPISIEYTGGCKDGLAHGKGIASGTDVYEGRFKNGLPSGQGKYVWKDGSFYVGNWKEGKRSGKGTIFSPIANQEIKGIWKEDKLVREYQDPPYEVTYKNSITGINFYEDKSSTFSDRIEFVFQRDGNQSRIASGLEITASDGLIKKTSTFSGIENVTFPFEGRVEFVAQSRMGTVVIKYDVKYKITKKGSWRIVIRY